MQDWMLMRGQQCRDTEKVKENGKLTVKILSEIAAITWGEAPSRVCVCVCEWNCLASSFPVRPAKVFPHCKDVISYERMFNQSNRRRHPEE